MILQPQMRRLQEPQVRVANMEGKNPVTEPTSAGCCLAIASLMRGRWDPVPASTLVVTQFRLSRPRIELPDAAGWNAECIGFRTSRYHDNEGGAV